MSFLRTARGLDFPIMAMIRNATTSNIVQKTSNLGKPKTVKNLFIITRMSKMQKR